MSDNRIEGILHQADERSDGTLRDPAQLLRPLKGGITVPRGLARDLRLKPGLLLQVETRGKQVARVVAIEGMDPADWADHVGIYDSTALDPSPMLRLEHRPDELTTRIIDILAPVGFGQRGLIVAPPRSGKTILLQNIARGIAANYPHVALFLLLVDERPEEVTDMRRNVPGTVYASSNDNTIDMHQDLATLVIERCKRLVEYRRDVVVLLDSLTRLGRSFNVGANSGRIMSGGIDARALEVPKRLFGAARKLEEGGSLTILATCLIDTGSRMDQVIFEEFKGTGNMELTLDRKLADLRIFPAINVAQTGTRKEEKLFAPEDLEPARRVRRHLMSMNSVEAMKNLISAVGRTRSNAELFASMRQ
ncbi:MAG: transcription termination factor Rho [Phycisphaerae bacterium]|nr:transcription termination factor Rho [Phycisphaerae bacterium]MDW8262895.1 transcription termination factor Rho [Phycisphaerales bacterium]